MTQESINVGTGPNTKNGDTVRDAFIKVNQNFDEVYSTLLPTNETQVTGKFLSYNGTNTVWVDIIDGGAV